MSLILDGKAVDVAGLDVRSWLDVASMRVLREDARPRRTRWVRSIVLHTTQGDEPQRVCPGRGPTGLAARTVAAWGNDSRHAGAHLIVDGDATVWCLADIVRDATFHATSLNEVSVGIELAQTRQLEVWQAQLDAVVVLVDALTRLLGIQRQVHAPYRGSDHPVPRLAAGGEDCVGVFGHRDQSEDRGKGDPGDAIVLELRRAGYEAWDFAAGRDLAAWRIRQRSLTGLNEDGVPGPVTVAAVASAGRPHGMWVPRPGDGE